MNRRTTGNARMKGMRRFLLKNKAAHDLVSQAVANDNSESLMTTDEMKFVTANGRAKSDTVLRV